MQKRSNFGLGLIIGAVGGALAGIFLAPKSGKENRKVAYKYMRTLQTMIESGELQERVHTIFGNIHDESMRFYSETREEVMKKYAQAKEMNYEDYVALVQKVIDSGKETAQFSVDQLNKLKDALVAEWKEAEEKEK